MKKETAKQYAHRLLAVATQKAKEKSRQESLHWLEERAKKSYLWQRVLVECKGRI